MTQSAPASLQLHHSFRRRKQQRDPRAAGADALCCVFFSPIETTRRGQPRANRIHQRPTTASSHQPIHFAGERRSVSSRRVSGADSHGQLGSEIGGQDDDADRLLGVPYPAAAAARGSLHPVRHLWGRHARRPRPSRRPQPRRRTAGAGMGPAAAAGARAEARRGVRDLVSVLAA